MHLQCFSILPLSLVARINKTRIILLLLLLKRRKERQREYIFLFFICLVIHILKYLPLVRTVQATVIDSTLVMSPSLVSRLVRVPQKAKWVSSSFFSFEPPQWGDLIEFLTHWSTTAQAGRAPRVMRWERARRVAVGGSAARLTSSHVSEWVIEFCRLRSDEARTRTNNEGGLRIEVWLTSIWYEGSHEMK